MATESRVTQEVVEVFEGEPASAEVALTQEVVETYHLQSPPINLTQALVEEFEAEHPPNRLTQTIVEVWYTPREIPVRATISQNTWKLLRFSLKPRMEQKS